MELSIVKPGNAEAGTVSVSDVAFAREYNEDLVHQVVTAYMAGARQGTRAQKNRAAVSGGGKKPWRQKGTGRARAGTMRSIMSELARQDRLVVVESLDLEAPKTKLLVQQLGEYGLDNVLIVGSEVGENLYLAARNLHKVDVRDVDAVDPVSLIGFDKVMVTVDAVKKFEEMLG